MTRTHLLPFARAELAAREQSYPRQVQEGRKTPDEAGRFLAAWRAIVALLEQGETVFEPCLGTAPTEAWLELLAAFDAAVGHRARAADREQSISSAEALHAVRELRSLLIRSAAAQGARLTSQPEAQRKGIIYMTPDSPNFVVIFGTHHRASP